MLSRPRSSRNPPWVASESSPASASRRVKGSRARVYATRGRHSTWSPRGPRSALCPRGVIGRRPQPQRLLALLGTDQQRLRPTIVQVKIFLQAQTGQQLGLGLADLGKARLQHLGNVPMVPLAGTLEQGLIGGFLDQRVLEDIRGLRRDTQLVQEFRRH
jgi:hypothetical protein